MLMVMHCVCLMTRAGFTLQLDQRADTYLEPGLVTVRFGNYGHLLDEEH